MNEHNYKIAASIGGRKEQQDFAGAAVTSFGLLVVVCDGMGGAKGGATASNMAVNIILQDIVSSNYPSPASALQGAMAKANAEIFKRSRNDEDYRGMGTTAAAIIIQREKATVAHVGDSRVYQLRSDDMFGNGVRKVFRTNDHSKVFELVKRGIMNEEQARTSNESNVILRALGIQPQVDVEISDNIPYLQRDRFLLCTDGVCGAVPEEHLLQLLGRKEAVESMVGKLIAAIDETGYKSGGEHDNLTAALIECNSNSILKAKMNMNTKIIIASLSILLFLSLGYIGYSKMNRTGAADVATLTATKDSLESVNKILTDSLAQYARSAEQAEVSTATSVDKGQGNNASGDADHIADTRKPSTPAIGKKLEKKETTSRSGRNGTAPGVAPGDNDGNLNNSNPDN